MSSDPTFRAKFRTDPMGWTSFKDKGFGFGQIGALHKAYVDGVPHRFFNELVAGALAQFLRLPIPPFCMTYFHGQDGVEIKKTAMFSSVDYAFESDPPPPAEFDACVEKFPNLCTGILLFDILIANPDRTKDNLWADNPTRPTRLLIFDHDRALLGDKVDCEKPTCRTSLLLTDLGLRWSNDSTSYWHPFLKRLETSEFFDEWQQKSYTIPDWFIKDICVKSAKVSRVPASDRESAIEFLNYRKRHLDDIVRTYQKEFAGIKKWGNGLW